MNSQSGLKRFRNQPSSQSAMIGAMMLLVVSSASVQAFAPSSTTYPHYFGVAKATHLENERSSKDAALSYTQISSTVFGTATLAYAGGTASSPQMSDFQRRMINIMGNQPNSPNRTQKGKPPKQPNSQKPKNVEQVLTLQDYKSVVGDETEKLVVVRFYAPWCKACKAVAPAFYRTARDNPNVKFVELPVTEQNANLHQGLGVPSLPYFHVYHPDGGLVEELRGSRKFFPRVRQALQTYVDGSCDLSDDECSSPYAKYEELESTPIEGTAI